MTQTPFLIVELLWRSGGGVGGRKLSQSSAKSTESRGSSDPSPEWWCFVKATERLERERGSDTQDALVGVRTCTEVRPDRAVRASGRHVLEIS